MASEIALFRNFGLATPNSVSYSSSINAFVGNVWVSCSGRTYCNNMRFSEGIIIKEDVGSNDYGTYLNAVHVFDLKTKKLLCEKVFPMYYGLHYSKNTVKRVAKESMLRMLEDAAKAEGARLDHSFANAKLEEMLNQSFEQNQLKVME